MDRERASSDPPGKRKRDADGEDDDIFSQPAAGTTDLLSFENGDEEEEDDDDSEDELEDDDDESIVGPCEYEESVEPFPTCVAFDKDFAQVAQDLVSIPAKVVQIIDDNGCTSRRTQSCRSNAFSLARIPRVHCEKIALLGNTGAGMASLPNPRAMRC